MSDGLVQILDGNTFVVSDLRGDIEASSTDPTGLFSFDTRFLDLDPDRERRAAPPVDDLQYFETCFFLVPGTGTVYVDAKLSVIRERAVGDGFHEELTILSHDEEPVELEVQEAASDFADLFEVKDALEKKGTYSTRVEKRKLLLGYERDTYRRLTTISASAPAEVDETGLTFSADRPPRRVDDRPRRHLRPAPRQVRAPQVRAGARARARTWAQPEALVAGFAAARVRLRLAEGDLPAKSRRSGGASLLATCGWRGSLLAAGLPWFMTMFGRDSILTSLQALPFTPELAAATLLALGGWQGSRVDDFRDEDPGRILHEMRYGELTAFEERPHSPYYGAADATPLFVVLLDEYERWSGDRRLVRELERGARRRSTGRRVRRPPGQRLHLLPAPQRADRPREPVLERPGPRSPTATGASPAFRAPSCELQGYAYDAKLRGARLAREIWNDSPTPTSWSGRRPT